MTSSVAGITAHFKTYFESLEGHARRGMQSRFLRNAGTAAFYTVVGQLIAVASAPVLTRVYSPEAFASFGLMMSYLSAVSVLTCLNYELAIPAPLEEEVAARLAYSASVVSLLMTIVLMGIYLLLVKAKLLGYGNLPTLSVALVGIFLFVAALAAILNYWSVRRQEFGAIGVGIVIQNVGRTIAQVLFGLGEQAWLGLISGEIVGRVLNVFYLSRRNYDSLHDASNRARQVRVASTLGTHRQFPLVLLPAMFSDQILGAAFVPFMAYAFGLNIAGQYFLMRRVLDMPVALVSRTFADTFYVRIAHRAARRPEALRPFVLTVFTLIAICSFLLLLPLLVAGPSLFAKIFGEPWRQAGLFAALMVPAAVMNLGVNPIARVFALSDRPAFRYVYTLASVVGLGVVVSSSWLLQLTPSATVATAAAMSFIAYASYLVAAYIAAGHISATNIVRVEASEDQSR
jgi:O-antigen/teichoic acid export membrane protein